VSLIARTLEEHGIPTVVIGTARDIVETCGVPRFLFVDFPLGSPCGEPWNVGQQGEIFEMALGLLESAQAPRSTREAGLAWSKGEKWKSLVFTEAQPYQSGEVQQAWLERKEKYRELREKGAL
jgi:hypothetical protein